MLLLAGWWIVDWKCKFYVDSLRLHKTRTSANKANQNNLSGKLKDQLQVFYSVSHNRTSRRRATVYASSRMQLHVWRIFLSTAQDSGMQTQKQECSHTARYNEGPAQSCLEGKSHLGWPSGLVQAGQTAHCSGIRKCREQLSESYLEAKGEVLYDLHWCANFNPNSPGRQTLIQSTGIVRAVGRKPSCLVVEHNNHYTCGISMTWAVQSQN